jgi:hypothetical protein
MTTKKTAVVIASLIFTISAMASANFAGVAEDEFLIL